MSAVKFAAVSPHPPIIVREVGRGRERETQATIAALEQLAADIGLHRPETVLLMATHGPLNPGAFFLLTAPFAEGDFSRWGAPQVRLRFQTDRELANAIAEQAERSGLPLDTAERWDSGLDWSCTVPLYYLRRGMGDARLVAMNISFLPPRDHFEFGRAVRRAIDAKGQRTVIVASADLSHRLSPDGPYGFHPSGPEFDRRIQDAVARWDVQSIIEMDLEFREAAGDDAVPSLSFLMGVLDGLRVRPRILSYEGPFGVGYMVAAIDILEEAEDVLAQAEAVARAEEAEPDPLAAAAPSPSPLLLRQAQDELRVESASHPLVRLASDAVEVYIRERRVLQPGPAFRPGGGLPLLAGCFVSIKMTDGTLRGCIGSVDPVCRTLAQEVVRNAIDAASRDPRFSPVTPHELADLVFSVDVLAPPEPVESLDRLDPRLYGIIVQCGPRRGLLLPDIDGVHSAEQQVAIAMSKALIEPDEAISLWRFTVTRLT